jgi:hypothetical protein
MDMEKTKTSVPQSETETNPTNNPKANDNENPLSIKETIAKNKEIIEKNREMLKDLSYSPS